MEHIYYENIRSIPAKTNIKYRITASSYRILCFTETWLNEHHKSESYFPDNFDVYRRDRGSVGGGVAIAVDKQLGSKHLDEINNPICECICVKIPSKPKPLIIYVGYLPQWQQTNNIAYSTHFGLINQLFSNYTGHRIFVVGDWNIARVEWEQDESESHYLPTNLSAHTRSEYFSIVSNFLQNMQELPSYQLSNVKNIANNVLDLVFVDDSSDVTVIVPNTAITTTDQTDVFHPPLNIVFITEKKVIEPEYKSVYCYNRGNYARMKLQLDSCNFAHEFRTMDVNAAFDYFHSTLLHMITENVPQIKIKVNTNKPKWWTPQLQRLKNRKNKLFKRQQMGDINDDYINALREFDELHDNLRNEYISSVEKNIQQNPAEFWKYVKSDNVASDYPAEMHYNGENSNSTYGAVNLFAKYFEQSYSVDNTVANIDEIYTNAQQNDMNEIDISMFDVENVLSDLKPKGSVGPDEVHPRVIKECADSLIFPIWLLFKLSIQSGKVPDLLKSSRILPLHKKGDRSNVENYRIIAISSVILKLFEMIIKKKLMGIVNPMLSNAQHGFRPNRSITTNLINLSFKAHSALENGTQLDVFYGDFKSAFDRVNHNLLISKLKKFGITRMTAKWLLDFLRHRTNFVQIGKYKSRAYEASSGVPAGSTLGPLLFLIFIDDITEVVVKASVLLFADDIKIFMAIKSSCDTFLLQKDIDNLLSWCKKNKLFFNEQKCAILTITRSTTFINALYKMKNHTIERRNEMRDLGVIVDKRFTFTTHIEKMIAGARQSFGFIKKVTRNSFSLETQKLLYTSYVRSKLEFGAVVWDPYQVVHKNSIESVQKSFLRYLLGTNNTTDGQYRLPPYKNRCEQVGLQTLVDRRKVINLMFAFDVFHNNMCDVNISSNFVRVQRNRNLRSHNILSVPMYTNDYSYNQPIAKLMRLVNEFSVIYENENRKQIFKSNVRNLVCNNVIDAI